MIYGWTLSPLGRYDTLSRDYLATYNWISPKVYFVVQGALPVSPSLSVSLTLFLSHLWLSLSVSQPPPPGFSAFSILKPCVPVVTEVEIMQLHHESPFLQQTTNGLLGARTVCEKAAQRDLSCCLSVSCWKPQPRLWHLGVFLKVFCKPVSNTIFRMGLKAK